MYEVLPIITCKYSGRTAFEQSSEVVLRISLNIIVGYEQRGPE